MAFTPTPQQLNKLRKAIKSYNSAISRMNKSGKYTVTPEKTSLSREREFISSSRDLSLRVNQLNRVLTTNKKDAQKPVKFHGTIMPKYMKDEIRNIVRAENKLRKAVRADIIPDFDELSKPMKGYYLSNKNLTELNEEDYLTGDDFLDLIETMYPNIPKKAEIYIDTWLDNNGDRDTAKKIREMANENPEGFKRLMESADIEKEIEYVYPEFTSNAKYKRTSAFKDPVDDRYRKAKSYWEEQYNNFKNSEGYFSDKSNNSKE